MECGDSSPLFLAQVFTIVERPPAGAALERGSDERKTLFVAPTCERARAAWRHVVATGVSPWIWGSIYASKPAQRGETKPEANAPQTTLIPRGRDLCRFPV